MDAAGICPKLTIRFPNAAPFEFWISLTTEPLSLRGSRVFPLSTCQLASMPPRASACPHVPSRPLVASRFSDPKALADPAAGPLAFT
jgi:hypothetical protein